MRNEMSILSYLAILIRIAYQIRLSRFSDNSNLAIPIKEMPDQVGHDNRILPVILEAVILDRREGNHNFSLCSCGGDPYCSNQNWNCPASGCFKRMYNKARALKCGELDNVIGSEQLTSSAHSSRSKRRGRCSSHSRGDP